MATLNTTELRLLASLRSDPAHLLLVDYLEKVRDDLTDELADPSLSEAEALSKLHHWRAFRQILSIIRNQPEAWAEEFKEFAVPSVETAAEPEWIAIQQKMILAAQKMMDIDNG